MKSGYFSSSLLSLALLLILGCFHIYAQEDDIYNELDSNSMTDEPQLSFDEEPKRRRSVSEGKAVTLSCAVTSIPPATIKWLRNGLLLPNQPLASDRNEAEKLSNFGKRTLQMASTKSQITVDCVDKSKEGEYSCVAENGYQSISANSTLLLRNPEKENGVKPAMCVTKKRRSKSGRVGLRPSPAKISIWTDMRMEFSAASAQLFCRASGYPSPFVSWYQVEELMNEDGETKEERKKISNDSNHLILGNGDLLVRRGENLEEGQALYECVAENPLGRDTAQMILVSLEQ